MNKVKGAEFSNDRKYRYRLWRVWDERKPIAMCIGLNPSKASAVKNDATIIILMKVLSRLGYGGFYMMNLFAWITSKPKELLVVADPLGENNKHLLEVEQICNDIIICWGTFKQATERRKEVLSLYPQAKCFGKNLDGTPFHPRALSYIKDGIKNAQLYQYNERNSD